MDIKFAKFAWLAACVAALAWPAAAEWLEADYTRDLAARLGGVANVTARGPAGAVEGFCDVATDELAIEVEFAVKWKEAPSQALLYARLLNRRPAIALVWDPKRDGRYLRRLLLVLDDVRPTVALILVERREQ